MALNIFEGQINSFMGHTGAGKTMSFSLLTGIDSVKYILKGR